jgi:hypothetical protein
VITNIIATIIIQVVTNSVTVGEFHSYTNGIIYEVVADRIVTNYTFRIPFKNTITDVFICSDNGPILKQKYSPKVTHVHMFWQDTNWIQVTNLSINIPYREFNYYYGQ